MTMAKLRAQAAGIITRIGTLGMLFAFARDSSAASFRFPLYSIAVSAWA